MFKILSLSSMFLVHYTTWSNSQFISRFHLASL